MRPLVLHLSKPDVRLYPGGHAHRIAGYYFSIFRTDLKNPDRPALERLHALPESLCSPPTDFLTASWIVLVIFSAVRLVTCSILSSRSFVNSDNLTIKRGRLGSNCTLKTFAYKIFHIRITCLFPPPLQVRVFCQGLPALRHVSDHPKRSNFLLPLYGRSAPL